MKTVFPKRTYSYRIRSRLARLNILVAGISLLAHSTIAQTVSPRIRSAEKPLETLRNSVGTKDGSLAALIDNGSALDKIATGFGFTEGITWTKGGYLLFSDMAANVLYRRDKNGQVTTFMEKSGYPYEDVWRVGMRFNNGRKPGSPGYEEFNLIGSDGMVAARNGDLLLATWTGRSIDRIAANGKRTVLADKYQGKRFGGPNDLVELRDGGIYFTDTYGSMTSPDNDPANEMKIQAVYYFKEGGPVVRVVDDISTTNGLAVSPDEKYLYVNGSAGRFVRRYEIQPDRTVRNGSLFFDLSKEAGEGITDGMKTDTKGNLWTTGPGGVWILSPGGKVLGRIHIPDPCTNLVFGDDDRKTLYVSTPESIYRIRTKVSGL